MQLCKLDDIPVGSARGFVIAARSILVARTSHQEVAAYLNRCPHLGVPLNWQADDFMDSEAVFIRCATHGALFEPQTGLCIQGPCRGESLWQLSCFIEENSIHIDESELPSPYPCAAPV